MSKLSHVDDQGRASMVDVSEKSATERVASAEAIIALSEESFRLVMAGEIKKGDVLATARIAGIQAAKQTAQLIPLCHPLALGEIKIDIVTSNESAEVKCTAQTVAQTGVEMEALVGVTVALLTIYDMCKAVDKGMQLYDVHLVEKTKGAVAVSQYETHRPHAKENQRRVAQRSTATTNDSQIKRRS